MNIKIALLTGLCVGALAFTSGCGTVTSNAGGSGTSTTSIPVTSKITVLSNVNGVEDRVVGVPGASEANSIIKVYNNANSQLKYLAVSAADGSFNFPIGDDVIAVVAITATNPGKAESASVVKNNPAQ